MRVFFGIFLVIYLIVGSVFVYLLPNTKTFWYLYLIFGFAFMFACDLLWDSYNVYGQERLNWWQRILVVLSWPVMVCTVLHTIWNNYFKNKK